MVFVLCACGPENSGGGADATAPCVAGETQCNTTGTVVLVCDESGAWVDQAVCLGETPYCLSGACVACVPNESYCNGNDVMRCSADGSGATVAETCNSRETCWLGACADQCEVVAQDQSNVGCHFWPTPVNNAQLDPLFDSDFAVVVHNANAEAVSIEVTKGAAQVTQVVVAAGEVEVI